MTTLALYGGPLKRQIIKQAYGGCGQSFTEFDISSEEMIAGLQLLNNAMAALEDEQGIVLGYNYPNAGSDGSPEDESGIPAGAVKAIVGHLARELAPTIGKTITPDASFARAWTNLLSKYTTVPQMEMGRNTVRGAGNRRYGLGGAPYFVTDVSADEPVQ